MSLKISSALDGVVKEQWVLSLPVCIIKNLHG